jgi:hypothetical protein
VQLPGHSGCLPEEKGALEEARATGWIHGVHGRFRGWGTGVCVPKDVGKSQQILQVLKDIRGACASMDHNILEMISGFLIYVSRTYPPMVPFDKGLHLTIGNWRPDWDGNGWKLSRAQIEAKYVTDKDIDRDLEESQRPVGYVKPPLKVKPADRLEDDIEVILSLTEDEMPPLRWIHARRVRKILYCLGDASGAVFGWNIDLGEEVYCEYGELSEDISEESSNYREIRNLVNARSYQGGGGGQVGRLRILTTKQLMVPTIGDPRRAEPYSS